MESVWSLGDMVTTVAAWRLDRLLIKRPLLAGVREAVPQAMGMGQWKYQDVVVNSAGSTS